MHSVLKIPVVRSLHDRGLLFPALILLAVAGVLVHGAFQRGPAVEAARTNKSEATPPSYGGNRPDVEKTILAYESDFWLQLAQGARSKIDLVSSKHIPAVYISPTLAVASIAAAEELIRDRQKLQLLEARAARESTDDAAGALETPEPAPESVADDGTEVPDAPEEDLRLVAVDARLGIALFELTEPTETPFALVSPASLPPGSFLAAITVEADKRLRISPGFLVSAEKTGVGEGNFESFEVSFQLGEAPATAAVVDLDGNLAGLAVRSREGTRILSAPAVSRLVQRLAQQPPCYSIEVADLPPEAAKLLGLRNGVFVERVLEDSFKPTPSIHAGDVILRWAGKSVESVEQFYDLYGAQSPGGLTRYTVRRGGQSIAGGTVMPGRDCRPVAAPPLYLTQMGAVLEWAARSPDGDEGWRVTALIEDAPASESGLRLDDWILSVNGRQVSRRSPERSFAPFEKRNRSLALSVRRGDRVKLLAVSPAEVETP